MLYLWRALSNRPFYASAERFLLTAETVDVGLLEAVGWAQGWRTRGWWAIDPGDRLQRVHAGYFTLAGAKEVAFQAAQLVTGQPADEDLAGGSSTK